MSEAIIKGVAVCIITAILYLISMALGYEIAVLAILSAIYLDVS